MKTKTLIFCGALALALTGCIASVKPFYTEKDVAFETALLGEWKNEEELWKFTPEGTNQYKLVVRQKNGKQGEVTATLFKLKTKLFLDLIPSNVELKENQSDIVAAAVYLGHLAARVDSIKPRLKLAFFDYDKLATTLKNHPEVLAHYREGDRLVLTADTPALQKFLLEHADDGALFGEPGELAPNP